jgi:hypothetical protein
MVTRKQAKATVVSLRRSVGAIHMHRVELLIDQPHHMNHHVGDQATKTPTTPTTNRRKLRLGAPTRVSYGVLRGVLEKQLKTL